VDRLWEEVAEQRIDCYSPPTPESPGSTESVASNWPNYGSSNPGSPTGSLTLPASPRTVRGPFFESARLVGEPRHIVVNRSPADAATEPDGRLSSASPRTVRGPFSEYARLVGELRHIVVNRSPADAATEPDGQLSSASSASPRTVRHWVARYHYQGQTTMCCRAQGHQQGRDCHWDRYHWPTLLHFVCLLCPTPVSRGHQRTVFCRASQ
jgi:hypothetical protein